MDSFLSHLHTELRKALHTRRGATHAPSEVPRNTHKTYERMEKIILPVPSSLATTLQDALEKRISYVGGSTAPLTLEALGTLLGLSMGKRLDTHRPYPSGGALYPIETYVVSNVLSLTPAVFHYNPTEHALEKLWDLPAAMQITDLARTPDDLFFSTLVIFTGVWRRSSAKYGDLAYHHALLEAGHMSQNVLLAATGLGLNSRPYAGFNDENISTCLDLNPLVEQPVHTILLSR